MDKIKVVAFDADDTLWVNEPFFRAAEDKFCAMLEDFLPYHTVSRELLTTEIANIKRYGYGIKSFMLSMIETAIRVTNKTIKAAEIERIIAIGDEMLNQPLEIIDGVEEVLKALQGKYRLVVATKGDLLDQEKKLKRSGLADYFHHTEIVSEKDEAEYRRIIKHLDVEPHEFVMIGNSLKSDILPVLNIGGYGIHIPFHITWELEKVHQSIEHQNFKSVEKVQQVLAFL